METQYKWKSPRDWLLYKVNHEWDESEKVHALISILDLLDADDIQDIFQGEMDMDGYFDRIEPGDTEQSAAYFRLAQSKHIFLEEEHGE